MTTIRALRIAAALALGAALPTLAALGYYLATGDPTVRPLGLTQKALVRFVPAQGGPLTIDVTVLWGQGSPLGVPRERVEQIFGETFGAYDIGYTVSIVPVPGRQVRVVYAVRGSTIGPYPLTAAARGIPGAVSAYRMLDAAGPGAGPGPG